MRRLVFALLSGLVLVSLPLQAQTVTLSVCNVGIVDIDVFVSLSNSHIRPATCVVVAKSSGAMEPAHVGLAFTDSRGQWGAARRFGGVPYIGVKNFPLATRLAMSLRRETPPKVLTLATRSETVRRGNVSLPMQLLFQPSIPDCRTVPTGGGATLGRTTIVEVTTICEDLGYTLKVEAYPDSREIRLGAPSVSGEISEDGPVRISEKTVVDWAKEEAERKTRDAPEPVNWSDLLPVLRRYYGRPELRDVLPPHIVIRGTVAKVEVNAGMDVNNNNLQVVNVVFLESPFVPDPRPDREPYSEFNVCTTSPDIFQDVFGADFRTSMIGKSIEVRGDRGGCRGLRGSIEITLARQVRPVPSARFAAGTRVWVPPPVVAPPPRPAPTSAEIEADIARRANAVASDVEFRAKGRMRAACVAQAERASSAKSANQVAINQATSACMQAADADSKKEAQKAQACAHQVIRADIDSGSRDLEGLQAALLACAQAQ